VFWRGLAGFRVRLNMRVLLYYQLINTTLTQRVNDYTMPLCCLFIGVHNWLDVGLCSPHGLPAGRQ